jgi:hypothetical protein
MAASGSSSSSAQPEWQRAQAARLDFYETALAALQEERRAAAASAGGGSGASSSRQPGGSGRAEPTAARPLSPGWAAAADRPPSYGVLPPRELPATPEAELASLRFARSAPLGFSPLRRAAMIEGRPVVAPRGLLCRLGS